MGNHTAAHTTRGHAYPRADRLGRRPSV